MADMKHVGRIIKSQQKVLVVFRTLPGDSGSCLVVPTVNLPDDMHNALISAVESPSGQSAFEFAEVLARGKFPDGSTMLPALHAQNRLIKIGTGEVEMLPNFSTKILLAELNQLIAEQRGISVDELAVKDPYALKPGAEVSDIASVNDMPTTPVEEPDFVKTSSASINTDEQPAIENLPPDEAARRYRSEADRLAKQAAEMRRKAEALAPTKKAK